MGADDEEDDDEEDDDDDVEARSFYLDEEMCVELSQNIIIRMRGKILPRRKIEHRNRNCGC